jgi:thymidylate kinase
MAISASRPRAVLISFSGVDGAGKSTQIEHVVSLLENSGLQVRRLAFWDDIVVMTRYREGFVHKVYKSERGIGAPGNPVERRDKNVRGWHLTLARHCLYLLDTLHLRQVVARELHSGVDVLILDRYIYDELVNLPLHRSASRAFFRLMVGITPRPDLAFLLDADPEAARARKPEYPVAFMKQCRAWYHRLAELLGTMTVIAPLPLPEAKQLVTNAVRHALAQTCDVANLRLPRSA